MHASTKLLVLVAFGALAACNRTAATHPAETATVKVAGGPQQAAGLWSQTVSDRRGARTLRYCLDAAAAASLAEFDRQLSGRCGRHDIAKAADGTWRFSTSCDMGAGGKVATEGVMRGNFGSHYFVEAETQTVDAADASANGPSRVMADLQRLGDCPTGMKPGDAVMPSGGRSRLDALAAHA